VGGDDPRRWTLRRGRIRRFDDTADHRRASRLHPVRRREDPTV